MQVKIDFCRARPLLLGIFLSLFLCSVKATEQSDAEAQAVRIMQMLSAGSYAEIWDCCMSSDLKDIMTKSSFIAQISIGRGPFGPMTSPMNLINSAFATAAPDATGKPKPKKGKFYSFTYETTYSTSNYYEAISLVMEGDQFKFWGINGAPRK